MVGVEADRGRDDDRGVGATRGACPGRCIDVSMSMSLIRDDPSDRGVRGATSERDEGRDEVAKEQAMRMGEDGTYRASQLA